MPLDFTPTPSEQGIKDILSKCFFEDVLGKTSFFDNFYKENGNGYFFLFKKNLSVTNIQFAELVSLLKNHSGRGEQTGIGSKFQFLTAPQFNDTIKELIDSYALERADETLEAYRNRILVAASHFAEKYYTLFEYVVAIDAYHTSCSVYLPPYVVTDLEKICGLSGYIFSCGLHIYVRNIDKSKSNVLISSVSNYLEKNPPESNKKIFFTVYAHEDFSLYDLDSKDETKNGRHGVKIHEEKYFMGQTSLVDLIKELRRKFPEVLHIPERGSYKHHKSIFREEPLEPSRSIWLIMDKKVDARPVQYPYESSYYICYENRYTNANQLHLFDENKIAWKSNTTLPHTLCSAMLNIALSNVEEDIITICDPFLGSGTTFFESLKYDNIRFHGYDLDSFSQVLIEYNREFFAYSEEKLRNLESEFQTLISEAKRNAEELNLKVEKINSILKNPGNGEFEFNSHQIQEINRLDYREKALFFIVLRIKIKYNNKFVRTAKEDISGHLGNEIGIFVKQLQRYRKLAKWSRLDQVLLDSENEEALISWHGLYSKSLSINMSKFQDCDLNKIKFGPIANVRELQDKQYDIIITDPPYGFNTNDKVLQLADLYHDFLERVVSALKDNGQLVLCLPEKSFSGKTSPYFTHKEIVFQRILSICNQKGYEMVAPIYMVPNRELFKPPYYWNAERALSRSIVHIRIRHPREIVSGKGKLAIFIIGPSGAGKSTLARHLKGEYTLKPISGGDILRKLAKGEGEDAEMAREVLNRGGAANDDLIMRHYAKHMKTSKDGIVFDGNPSGKNQARRTLSMLQHCKHIIIIKLSCSEDTSFERARDNNQERNDKVTQNIRNRLNWFSSEVMDAYNFLEDKVSGVLHIDAEVSIEEVRQQAMSFINKQIGKC